MPSSAWARSTASHSCRSATTLCSGLKIVAIAAEAYRPARTFGIAGLAVTAAIVPYLPDARLRPVGRASTVSRGSRRLLGWIGLLRGQIHYQPPPVAHLGGGRRPGCGILLCYAHRLGRRHPREAG